MVEQILFWGVIVFTAASAVLVATARKILHAAFALCMCFLGVAGIYLFLHADFLAAVQLIVYVGGILVLILFGVMFSSHTQDAPGEKRRSATSLVLAGLVASAALLMLLILIGRLAPVFDRMGDPAAAMVYKPSVGVAPGETGLGHLLLGEYLLPFELASIVILAALLGAVVVARKETK
jgi:NADH-quinone oxidoreductase subunit J